MFGGVPSSLVNSDGSLAEAPFREQRIGFQSPAAPKTSIKTEKLTAIS
ncbi:hypothetical protein SAMN00120144_0734 [Hymenobacter roseosalivarius DSM 11622]|uniref:Uncharacterized protein n=1 Tax=Hymenobacter roseosalivarius DSM 11622 TaxID=645990 RepID=A0A1W1UR73_9BACT|nr:hypothetical protein SAMN00120144_0734 [Hymenobacter roseosalivarius DSM 11622]